MILSHLDYCNALYYHLPVYLLKEAYWCVTCCCEIYFWSHGSLVKENSNISILEKLHILPIKFRIMFKIALMTYKCFHNIAPAYIKNMLSFHQPIVSHNVRSNTDHLKLEPRLDGSLPANPVNDRRVVYNAVTLKSTFCQP